MTRQQPRSQMPEMESSSATTNYSNHAYTSITASSSNTRRSRINSNNSEENGSTGSGSNKDSPAIINLEQGENFMDMQQQQQQHHHHHHHHHHYQHNGASHPSSSSSSNRDHTPETRASSSSSSRTPDRPGGRSPRRSSSPSQSSSKMSRENNGSGKSNSSNGGGGGGGGRMSKSGNGSGNSSNNNHHHTNNSHQNKDFLNVGTITHASSTSDMDHHHQNHRTPSPSLHSNNTHNNSNNTRHHQRMNRSKNNIHSNNNNNHQIHPHHHQHHHHHQQQSNSGSNYNIGDETDFDNNNDNTNNNNNNNNSSNNNSSQPSPDPSAMAGMGRRRSSMPNVGDPSSFLVIPPEETRGSKLRRVRSFKTTSKGAVVNRGDSFKKKSTHSLRSAGGNTADARQQLLQQQILIQHQIQLQNQLQQAAAAAAAAGGEPDVVDDPYAVEVTPSIPTYFRIIMMGGVGTGKSTLAKQFMTSDFVDNTEDNADAPQEMTVSVLLDGEESSIQVIDPVNRNVIEEGLDQILDAYVVVFAINDHSSFQAVQELVRYLRVEVGVDRVMLLVGNKTDLVRKRKVSAEEARLVAETYDCKYTETSASLNHGVDELLVGVLTQIRLHMRIPFTTIVFPGKGGQHQDERDSGNRRSCKGPRKFFSRLFRRSGRKKLRECENLHAL